MDTTSTNLRKFHRYCREQGYTSLPLRAWIRKAADCDYLTDGRFTREQVIAARVWLERKS